MRVLKGWPLYDELRLYLRAESVTDGVRRFAYPVNKLEFKLQDSPMFTAGEELTPLALLDATTAQILMDDLWNCGIRPSEGSGSAGSFAAQGRHLEDFRALVARSYGVELK